MARKKTVVIEKDGVRAEATEETFKGLAARGWTVVDDGDKDEKNAAETEAKEAEKLQEQEQKLFGPDDKE
jgi:hypothetical protein